MRWVRVRTETEFKNPICVCIIFRSTSREYRRSRALGFIGSNISFEPCRSLHSQETAIVCNSPAVAPGSLLIFPFSNSIMREGIWYMRRICENELLRSVWGERRLCRNLISMWAVSRSLDDSVAVWHF